MQTGRVESVDDSHAIKVLVSVVVLGNFNVPLTNLTDLDRSLR